MRVVLTSHGSTGDIYPMISLGVALREAGHSVRFATSPPFGEEIERFLRGKSRAGRPRRRNLLRAHGRIP